MMPMFIIGLVFVCSLSTFSSAKDTEELRSLPLRDGAQGIQYVPTGIHYGNFDIRNAGTIECEPGAIVDARGKGNAITIAAEDVRLRNCTIRNWGQDLGALDSGIFVTKRASNAIIEHNHLQGPGFGIWLDAAPNAVVRGNRIQGEQAVRSQDRGNGIQMFNTRGALVENNIISDTRDGIYIETADGNELRGNRMHDLRYGIHYMYSQNNRVISNYTSRTRTGYALMQSHHLEVIGNHSDHDQNYGILMNYITYSTITGNSINEVQQGTSNGGGKITGAEGKALFVYNSVFNTIEDNYFGYSDLGIHLTAGSEDNRISGNTFDHNQQQVKYVANRDQQWSYQGRGNFWSDYLGWDRNGDGIGDVPYEPNDNMDKLLWTYPQARLLLYSPAIETLRWVQRAFPVIAFQGVRDSAPLMKRAGSQSMVDGSTSQ